MNGGGGECRVEDVADAVFVNGVLERVGRVIVIHLSVSTLLLPGFY